MAMQDGCRRRKDGCLLDFMLAVRERRSIERRDFPDDCSKSTGSLLFRGEA
jgi:hypothetical protein